MTSSWCLLVAELCPPECRGRSAYRPQRADIEHRPYQRELDGLPLRRKLEAARKLARKQDVAGSAAVHVRNQAIDDERPVRLGHAAIRGLQRKRPEGAVDFVRGRRFVEPF